MLIGLNVKNLALIKEAEVMFGEGLNIITGETGAGKSLVIGSVNLALGKRADKDIVRNGEREAEVELVFSIDDEDTKSRLEELDIPVSDDGLVILRRTIRDGRSVAKINSRTVTASALKSVSELLIDIHGQHEHQSLLYKRNHMRILDNFGSARLSDGLMRIKKDYLRLQEIKRELEDVPIDERQRTRQIDLLKYEIDEIEKAAFKEGEDEELEEVYIKLKNAGRVTSGVAGALSAVSGDGMNNAVSLIGEAVSSLKEIEGLDGSADALLGQI
ncbi:MAG: AAA family ATPase, partial [Lachnospiraceae bacterium]|nr:AAA family ATPase [Lachnospiraceae bacterium]